jgi:Phage tail lysozyme
MVDTINFDQNPTSYSAFDFAPLAKLGEQLKAQRAQEQLMSLAALSQTPAASGAAPSVFDTGSSTSYASSGGAGGANVKSWYDFARKPLDAGGLGLTHEQAAGKIANLQAESGAGIKPWGVTGDNGTAFGAAQWRGDRFSNLQKFAADRGLDYRSTAAQQGFMRHEYLGSERKAYDALTSTRTPQEAATAINRYYERSADRTGGRESNAARLSRLLAGGLY